MCSRVDPIGFVSRVGEAQTLQNCNINAFGSGCRQIGVPNDCILKVKDFSQGTVVFAVHLIIVQNDVLVDCVFSFLRIVLNRSVVNDRSTQSLRALSACSDFDSCSVTKYDQFRGVSLMKSTDQPVSTQPVLLFNPRLTTNSPYNANSRKMGKDYTNDELERMRLELVKGLEQDKEKSEQLELQEDEAFVDEMRRRLSEEHRQEQAQEDPAQERVSLSKKGKEISVADQLAAEDEDAEDRALGPVDFDMLEKEMGLQSKANDSLEMTEKQVGSSGETRAEVVVREKETQLVVNEKQTELVVNEKHTEVTANEKQTEPMASEKQNEAVSKESQNETTPSKEQDNALPARTLEEELTPLVVNPTARFHLMDYLVELEERLKERVVKEKPLPAYAHPVKTQKTQQMQKTQQTQKTHTPVMKRAVPNPAGKTAKPAVTPSPRPRYESRFANKQPVSASSTLRSAPSYAKTATSAAQPQPSRQLRKPMQTSLHTSVNTSVNTSANASTNVRSRLFLPSIFHSPAVPSISPMKPPVPKPQSSPTRHSFSPLVNQDKRQSSEFSPLEAKDGAARSRLPLPMVLRYPMMHSLSNRNSLVEGLEEVEEQKEVSVAVWGES